MCGTTVIASQTVGAMPQPLRTTIQQAYIVHRTIGGTFPATDTGISSTKPAVARQKFIEQRPQHMTLHSGQCSRYNVEDSTDTLIHLVGYILETADKDIVLSTYHFGCIDIESGQSYVCVSHLHGPHRIEGKPALMKLSAQQPVRPAHIVATGAYRIYIIWYYVRYFPKKLLHNTWHPPGMDRKDEAQHPGIHFRRHVLGEGICPVVGQAGQLRGHMSAVAITREVQYHIKGGIGT